MDQANEKVEELRERLRVEVAQEMQANVRRRFWRTALLRCGGCLGVYLIGFLVVASAIAYLAARSGLVEVPLLTKAVEHTRAPIRIIAPAPFDLDARLRSVLARGGPLTLSEAELTTFIRDELSESTSLPPRVRETVQVAIEEGTLELFAEMIGARDAQSSIRVRVRPELTADGRLDGTVEAAAVGSIGIPKSLATILLKRILGGLGAPTSALSGFTLRTGVLTIDLVRP